MSKLIPLSTLAQNRSDPHHHKYTTLLNDRRNLQSNNSEQLAPVYISFPTATSWKTSLAQAFKGDNHNAELLYQDTSNEKIVIGSGLINDLSAAELGFVLRHEAAHDTLDHEPSASRSITKTQECEANLEVARSMGSEEIAQYKQVISRMGGNGSGDHPSASETNRMLSNPNILALRPNEVNLNPDCTQKRGRNR